MDIVFLSDAKLSNSFFFHSALMQEKAEFPSREGKTEREKRCRSSYYCVVFSARVFLSNQQLVLSLFLFLYLAESECSALGVCVIALQSQHRVCAPSVLFSQAERALCFIELLSAELQILNKCTDGGYASRLEIISTKVQCICVERRSSFLFALLYDSSGAQGGCSRLEVQVFHAALDCLVD